MYVHHGRRVKEKSDDEVMPRNVDWVLLLHQSTVDQLWMELLATLSHMQLSNRSQEMLH